MSLGRTRESRLKKAVREIMDLSSDWLREALEVMEAEARRRAADAERTRNDRDRYAIQAASIRAIIDATGREHDLQGAEE